MSVINRSTLSLSPSPFFSMYIYPYIFTHIYLTICVCDILLSILYIYIITGGCFDLWGFFKWNMGTYRKTLLWLMKTVFHNYLSITAFSKHHIQLQKFVCLFIFGLDWGFSDHLQHFDLTKMEVSIWQSRTENICVLNNPGQSCNCGCTSAILL